MPRNLPFQIEGNDSRLHTQPFFSEILKTYPVHNQNEKIKIIISLHALPTTVRYLIALEEIGDIVAIIPKSSTKNENIMTWLRDEYGEALADNVDRAYLAHPENAVKFIKYKVKLGEKVIILDIGGYFAPALEAFNNDQDIQSRLIGIIEDTENGQQKYEESLQQLNGRNIYPIYSVARSPLKRTEDFNVGKSIVRAADTILRGVASEMSERTSAAVLGLGKVGEGILEELTRMRVKVAAYDINPIRNIITLSRGPSIVHTQQQRNELLSQADIIFCATGNKCLRGNDWYQLKDNVFIASCTSSDDELDATNLQNLTKKSVSDITQYTLPDNKKINLMVDGNGVNFVYGAVVGPYIHAVQGSIIVAMSLMSNVNSRVINELDEKIQKNIANIWMNHFNSSIPQNTINLLNPQQDFAREFNSSETRNNNNNSILKVEGRIEASEGGEVNVPNSVVSLKTGNSTAYNPQALPQYNQTTITSNISAKGQGSKTTVGNSTVAAFVTENTLKH